MPNANRGQSDAKQLATLQALEKRIDAATTIEDLGAGASDLAQLTKTQQRRALAAVAGATLTEIAKAEGVSKQAVAETLDAGIVKRTISDIVRHTTETNGETGKQRWLIESAVSVLGDLLLAKKPVIYGATYAMVPDNATRFATAVKILELAQMPPSPPVAKPAVSEDLAIEETTSTRRVARRRAS